MQGPFGIPRRDPKETYEAPAVTNGLWENNGFRMAAEHLRLPLLTPPSVRQRFIPCALINRSRPLGNSNGILSTLF